MSIDDAELSSPEGHAQWVEMLDPFPLQVRITTGLDREAFFEGLSS